MTGQPGYKVLKNLARLSKGLGFVFEPTDSMAVVSF